MSDSFKLFVSEMVKLYPGQYDWHNPAIELVYGSLMKRIVADQDKLNSLEAENAELKATNDEQSQCIDDGRAHGMKLEAALRDIKTLALSIPGEGTLQAAKILTILEQLK